MWRRRSEVVGSIPEERENSISGILPATNPGAPYLAFFARCGNIRGSLSPALEEFDDSLKLQPIKVREFPTSRKKREIWGTRIGGRESS